MGDIEIWTGIQILALVASKIPITMDTNGCPTEDQPFPRPPTSYTDNPSYGNIKYTNGFRSYGKAMAGRPYFLDDHELHRANPTMKTFLPQPLTAALIYLRAILSSTDTAQWKKLKLKRKSLSLWDLPIAPRSRHILEDDGVIIPDTTSLLVLDTATLQHSRTSAALTQAHAPAVKTS